MVVRSLLLLLMLSHTASAFAAQFEAKVDRLTLYQNEYLMLSINLSNSDTRLRAEGESPNIDLSILTTMFDLGTPQASNNFNIYRNRNRSSSTITVALFPKRHGTLTIPAFTLGKLSTATITIKVLKTATNSAPDIFIKSGLIKDTVWQGESTLAYLDLYHRITIKTAKLGGYLESDNNDTEILILPETNFTAQHQGIQYNVTRSSWHIASLTGNTITLHYPDLWVETKDSQNNNQSNIKRQRFPFSKQQLTIRPLPAHIPPQTIIGKPEINTTHYTEALTVGAAIPWSLDIRTATSLLSLPQTLPALGFPNGIQFHSDPTLRELDKSTSPAQSHMRYHGYLIAQRPGQYQLPDINIPYFDTRSQTLKQTNIKGEIIHVVAATTTQPSTTQDIDIPRATVITIDKDVKTKSAGWRTAFIIMTSMWLTTLLLMALWIKKQGSIKQLIIKQGDNKAVQVAHFPPLIAKLLTAMQAPNLESALNKLEYLFKGRPEEISDTRQLITDLQRHYYSQHQTPDNDVLAADELSAEGLSARVRKSIKQIIVHTALDNNAEAHHDWTPQAFTPSINLNKKSNND